MSKHDGMLVAAKVLRHTSRRLGRRIKKHGLHQAHEDLAEFEPALARFIARGCETVAGRLALSGAPTEIVQAVCGDFMRISLKAVQAMRRGQFEYWKADMNGQGREAPAATFPAQGRPPRTDVRPEGTQTGPAQHPEPAKPGAGTPAPGQPSLPPNPLVQAGCHSDPTTECLCSMGRVPRS